MSRLPTIVIIFTSILLIIPILRGQKGESPNIIEQRVAQLTTVGGAFELTNTTSRYLLTESLVKNQSVFFTEAQARLGAPDIVKFNGKYFSVFTPGISFLAIPFFFVGDIVGLPQLVTFLVTILFAIFNVWLISRVARAFEAPIWASFLSGFTFLFATNALPYSQTLTQHHASTTLLLLALLNAVRKRTFLNNCWLGAIVGAALLVDIPNMVTLLPILVFVASKHVERKMAGPSFQLVLKPVALFGILAGVIPLIMLFAAYNKTTARSYTKIAQLIGRSDFETKPEATSPPPTTEQRVKLPYNTRNMLNGLYILLVSTERSWFYYSPVVVIGLLGLFFSYKSVQTRTITLLIISSALFILLSYSMFGDPWGGWAFGPRYLIPATALACAGIGVSLQRFSRKHWFIFIFFILFFYSVRVNTLGALTTNAIPPKGEAEHLSVPIPFTYEYNEQLIAKNMSSSLLYNTIFSPVMSATLYHRLYMGLIVLIAATCYWNLLREKSERQDARKQ